MPCPRRVLSKKHAPPGHTPSRRGQAARRGAALPLRSDLPSAFSPGIYETGFQAPEEVKPPPSCSWLGFRGWLGTHVQADEGQICPHLGVAVVQGIGFRESILCFPQLLQLEREREKEGCEKRQVAGRNGFPGLWSRCLLKITATRATSRRAGPAGGAAGTGLGAEKSREVLTPPAPGTEWSHSTRSSGDLLLCCCHGSGPGPHSLSFGVCSLPGCVRLAKGKTKVWVPPCLFPSAKLLWRNPWRCTFGRCRAAGGCLGVLGSPSEALDSSGQGKHRDSSMLTFCSVLLW